MVIQNLIWGTWVTIVKEPKFAELYTPAYMESPIWNVFIFIGLLIESNPFTPFTITPNGDATIFGIISNDDVPSGIFWAVASCII